MAGQSAECWLNELLSQGSTLYFHLSRDVLIYMRYPTIAYTSSRILNFKYQWAHISSATFIILSFIGYLLYI